MHYIGYELQTRMELLGVSISSLAEMTFLSTDVIGDILENKTALEEIDEFDMSLICGVLHCDADYFVDSEVREKDLLIATMEKGTDTAKSENVKAKIQDFMNDYAFLNDVLLEMS